MWDIVFTSSGDDQNRKTNKMTKITEKIKPTSYYNVTVVRDCLGINSAREVDKLLACEPERFELDDCGNIIAIDGKAVVWSF